MSRETPVRSTVAVPAAPARVLELLPPHVDRVVVLDAPEDFEAVADLYHHVDPTPDDEVQDLLESLLHPTEA